MIDNGENDPAEPIEPTADQLAVQASVDKVAGMILADYPAASPTTYGDVYSAYGSISWAPRRDPSVDFSGWGNWEAWEFCNGVPQPNGKTVAVPTGGWIAWDSVTGAQTGFEPKSAMTAKHQAELLAVGMNDGRPTRVVHRSGAWQQSTVTLAAVDAIVGDARTRGLHV